MSNKTNAEENLIYEIFRACRFCGAGGGYKMPIITNLPLEEPELELRLKIRECLQLEVHANDKMPPLICELCVDKVNDFYEFLEMCRQVNAKTRQRLGLPTASVSNSDDDCILGMTEPVFVQDGSDDDEPLLRHNTRRKMDGSRRKHLRKVNKKTRRDMEKKRSKVPSQTAITSPTRSLRERDCKVKLETPSPSKRTTRQSEDDKAISVLKQDKDEKLVKSTFVMPRGILKKDVKVLIDATSTDRALKRTMDQDSCKTVPLKKVKIQIKTEKRKSPPLRERRKLSTPPRERRKLSPPPKTKAREVDVVCIVCGAKCKPGNINIHMRRHSVTFTNESMACNACNEWFPTDEEMEEHHAGHRDGSPYSCRQCYSDYDEYYKFIGHFGAGECIPVREVSDMKCEECWHTFPTLNLLEQHECGGEEARPGGDCRKCKRWFQLLSKLTSHEESCTHVSADDMKPVTVRVVRCDVLLHRQLGEHVDIVDVDPEFGLDTTCHYPFFPTARSTNPRMEMGCNAMVDIHDELLGNEVGESDQSAWKLSPPTSNNVTETNDDNEKVDLIVANGISSDDDAPAKDEEDRTADDDVVGNRLADDTVSNSYVSVKENFDVDSICESTNVDDDRVESRDSNVKCEELDDSYKDVDDAASSSIPDPPLSHGAGGLSENGKVLELERGILKSGMSLESKCVNGTVSYNALGLVDTEKMDD